nr:hypothetical protein BaRGS_028818 [Batillaria attramentaria]
MSANSVDMFLQGRHERAMIRLCALLWILKLEEDRMVKRQQEVQGSGTAGETSGCDGESGGCDGHSHGYQHQHRQHHQPQQPQYSSFYRQERFCAQAASYNAGRNGRLSD